MQLLFTLFVLILGFSPSIMAQVPIVDYYNLLAEYDDDIKHYAIKKEGEQWYSQSTHNQEKLLVTIDNTSDFLEIKDKGKNSTFSLQVALFKATDGNVYVGLVKNHFDIFLHGEIHILKLRNGKWNDVTEQLLPQLTYKNFMERKLSLAAAAAAYKPKLAHHLEFGYQLPTNGHTIEALMSTEVLSKKCQHGDKNIQEYCQELDHLKYTTIQLDWNAKEAKFILGKKK